MADNFISAASDPATDAAPGIEIPVAADGLTADGELPSEGDTVDFNVSGKVSRIDGETAYVMIDQANGSPLPTAVPADPTDPTEDDMSAMSAGAGSIY